jgi:hypothetical protein
LSGRGGYDFEGIGLRTSTWKANSALVSAVADAKAWGDDGRGAAVGKAVTITGDGEAGLGSNGNPLLGKIHQYEFDGTVTVQDGGYTVMPGVSGSLPDAGNYVAVNGSGAVVSAATGPAKAVDVDEENHTVMVLIC